MKFKVFIFVLIYSHLGLSEVYDFQEICHKKQGSIIVSQKIKDCSFRLGCHAESFNILLSCGGNKNFFSMNPKSHDPFESIVSVKYDYPVLMFTTKGATEKRNVSRVIEAYPAVEAEIPKFKVLQKKKDGVFKFNKKNELVFEMTNYGN